MTRVSGRGRHEQLGGRSPERSLSPLTTAVGWLARNASGELLAVGGNDGSVGAHPESSRLGYPVSNVQGNPGQLTGRFEHGTIVWTAAAGAVVWNID